jgi:bacterioferritin-associated ferredoxin
MIVCVCAGVSERNSPPSIADGATTVKEVARQCGAGAGAARVGRSSVSVCASAARRRPGAIEIPPTHRARPRDGLTPLAKALPR